MRSSSLHMTCPLGGEYPRVAHTTCHSLGTISADFAQYFGEDMNMGVKIPGGVRGLSDKQMYRGNFH